MPLYCCDCNCEEINKPLRHVRVLKECKSSSSSSSSCSSIESIHDDLKRLDLLCNLEKKCHCYDTLNLEKLKNATHEIKKLIDKVDDGLVKIKNKEKIIGYLNKHCTTHSNIYYYCCKTCCSNDVELIRLKHSQHDFSLDKYCTLCLKDYKIKARRSRSRSRSVCYSDDDDDYYISSDSYVCKPHEPWRSPAPLTNQYPFTTEKINKMRNS
jgi:hypothetical protein